MRTLGTLLLGIAIGAVGLLLVQHPGSLDIMRGAFWIAPPEPPAIRQTQLAAEWCAVHPQLPCK
jgi:hypothetical protein